MARRRNTFRLGLTVIVMFILFFGCLLFIGGSAALHRAQERVVVRFASGSALPELGPGAFVVYFGQKVGAVTEAHIIEDPHLDHQHFLELKVSLYQPLGLRQDCQIVASGPPLGGAGTLEIMSRGTLSAALATPAGPVYGSTAGFQAIVDMLGREFNDDNPEGVLALLKVQLDAQNEDSLVSHMQASLADVRGFTQALAAEMDREQQEALLHKLHHALDDVNRGVEQLANLIDDNRPKIDATVDHLATASEALDRASASMESAGATLDVEIMDVLARELQLPDQTPQAPLLVKVHEAMTALNEALADVKVTTAGAKEVVVLNKDRIRELVQNATEASAALKRGVKDVSLHPWKAFFQPSVGERRELHIFNVAREFSEAAAHLDSSTARLNSLLDAADSGVPVNDPELAQARRDLLKAIEKFTSAEQALWQELGVD